MELSDEKLALCKQSVRGMDDNMSLSDYIFVISEGNEPTDDHIGELKADLRFDAGLDEADIEPFLAYVRDRASSPLVGVLKEDLNIGRDRSLEMLTL